MLYIWNITLSIVCVRPIQQFVDVWLLKVLLLWRVCCRISNGACKGMLNLKLIVSWWDKWRVDYDSWKRKWIFVEIAVNRCHHNWLVACYLHSCEPWIVESRVASLVSSRETVLSNWSHNIQCWASIARSWLLLKQPAKNHMTLVKKFLSLALYL